jgi:hypothetical protein
MKHSRPIRSIAAIIALFCMLFMQLAVASYVCPGMGITGDNAQLSMPNCDGMDMNQPTLCHAHAHDQSSKQSFDKPELPAVSPFLPTKLLFTLNAINLAAIALPELQVTPFFNRATAPPIAIRNCCFRI